MEHLGGKGGAGTDRYRWAQNGRYRATEPASGDSLTRLMREGKDVVMLSCSLLADYDVEDALHCNGRQHERRCYAMTSTPDSIRQDIGRRIERADFDRHMEIMGRVNYRMLARSSGNFHASMVLVDPDSSEGRGMFLTNGMTPAALRGGRGISVDLGRDEMREAAAILRWAFWEAATHELAGDMLRDRLPLGRIDPVESKRILQTRPGHAAIQGRVMKMLDGRPNDVVVASPEWDAGHAVVDKMCKASQRGAKVTVLAKAKMMPSRKSLMKMKDAGVRILGFERLDAGAVMADSSVLVTSSGIGGAGLGTGLDLGLSLEGERARAVSERVREWTANFQYEMVRA